MLADINLTTQSTLDIQRTNCDPRILAAAEMYEQYCNGAYLLHKTTRAGCTTAMVAESLNRREQFACIVPTNSIADRTIVEDAKKYSDAAVHKIIHIPSNKACRKNEEMCEEYPDLKQLPILPLADKCDECEYRLNCPFTEIIRHPEAEGFVLTYSKLVALMMASRTAPDTRAQDILDMLNACRNMVFDEVHELQYGRSTSLTIYADQDLNKHLDINRYLEAMRKYPELGELILAFSRMLASEEIQVSRFEVFQAAGSDDFCRKYLRIAHDNKWKPAKADSAKFAISCYNEIIELTKHRADYGLYMPDILALYRMLNLVSSDRISIHGVRDRGKIRIRLTCQDWFYTGMIASYLMSIENDEKTIWLTSATICSYDYSQLFMNEERLQPVMFGRGGDPMDTNSKMLIFFIDVSTYNALTPSALVLNSVFLGMSTSLTVYSYDPLLTDTVLLNWTDISTGSPVGNPLIVISSPTVGFSGVTSKAETVVIPSSRMINSNNIHLFNRFNGEHLF